MMIEQQDIFPAYDQALSYGGYYPSGSTELAYRATMLDRAIRSDSVPQVEACIERGWLTPDCRALDNSHVVDYCDRRNARQVSAYLREKGWPEWNS